MEHLELLTPQQLMKMTQLGPTKIYEMLRTGEIPAINVSDGKKPVYRVPVEAFRRWQEEKIRKQA